MKTLKALPVIIISCVLVFSSVYAENQTITPQGWALLGADALLAGVTVWAAIGQNAAADDYEKLRSSLDNTTLENYWRLKYEKEKVDAKANIVLIAASAASVAVCYTLLDIFFLQAAFPVQVKAAYDPVNGGCKIVLGGEF